MQRPTYKNVTHDFKDSDDFIDWAQTQIGYGLSGWALDKDLLRKHNTTYSKDLCVFVPGEVNSFLIRQKSTRGSLPIGVTWDTEKSRYSAQMFKENTRVFLGRYDSIIEAFNAYKTAKEAYAIELGTKWAGKIDPRAWAALMTYEVDFND